MVMGLKPVKLLDAPMVPVDAQTGATWPYPPVLLMQAQNDQPDVVDIINRTISVFSRQVCAKKFYQQAVIVHPSLRLVHPSLQLGKPSSIREGDP